MFSHSEVYRIVGLSQRQVLSWTERGLVTPKQPAKKAGTKRGYNYINLLEFGVARQLLDVMGVQFYTAKTILEELRGDGEFEVWARHPTDYRFSFRTTIRDQEGEVLIGNHFSAGTKSYGQYKIGGTAIYDPDLIKKLPIQEVYRSEKQKGILYYFITKEEMRTETLRVITSGDFYQIEDLFKKKFPLLEQLNIDKLNGIIVVNLGLVKKEIDKNLPVE